MRTQDEEGQRPDVDLRFVLLTGLGLAVLTTVSLLVAAALYGTFSTPQTVDTQTGRIRGTALPSSPRLQTNPARDLKRLRAEEEEILEGYGWVDKERSILRIPIERAMEIVAREGLPARERNPEVGEEE